MYQLYIYINDFSFRCENHKRQDGMMVRWYDGKMVRYNSANISEYT